MLALSMAAFLAVACGESMPARRVRETGEARPTAEVPAGGAPAGGAPLVEPFASVRERSGCAFESRDALCAGLREHFHSSEWVSETCEYTAWRTSNGAFAEVGLVGVRVGDGPPPAESRTNVVLSARVGSAWFPIHITHLPPGGAVPPWSLDASGAQLTWDEVEGGPRDDPHGYGRIRRTIAIVDRGVPMIAAQAMIEQWRGDVDLACTRACNQGPSPPPYPGCQQRCASRVTQTRSWEQEGSTIRIGATVLRREGNAAVEPMAPAEEAVTRRLDARDEWMAFCAFTPVVRAVATPLPMDPASEQARARALEVVRRGRFRAVPGAGATTEPNAPRGTIEIYGTAGTGCGGGSCTTVVQFRTIEGSMPERGVQYFANERGNQVGCDAATLPEAGRSTYVEVAPARSREAIGCGFFGYDGTTERYWVVTRVLVPAR